MLGSHVSLRFFRILAYLVPVVLGLCSAGCGSTSPADSEPDAEMPSDSGMDANASGPDANVTLPDASRPDGSVPDGSVGLPDADAPSEKRPLKLRFETIELEGDPKALTELRFIPGSDEFLLLQKVGTVRHYRLNGDSAELLGEFMVPSVEDHHDCGLISMAFDPEFETNGYVYFGYCEDRDWSAVTRHVFEETDYTKIGTTRTPVLRVGMDDAPNAWHNVGSIGFDADGHLWALFGEKNADTQAQDRSNDLGGVVRVEPNREPDGMGYSTVMSNPFAGMPELSNNLVAYGLRTPWRGHMDTRGRLWIGDVGGNQEEVNILDAFDGRNFGWPTQNGPCTEGCDGFEDPILHWGTDAAHPYVLDDPDTEPTTRRSVWVGLEYRGIGGDRYDGRFDDRMVYGDFCAGWVRAASVGSAGKLTYDELAGHVQGVTSWDEAADGYAYLVTYGNCHTGPYKPGAMYRAVLDEG